MNDSNSSPLQTALLAETSELTEADYQSLAGRWIDRATAEAAEIRRVNSMTGASFIGRKDNGTYAGLLIPYRLPDEPRVREWRLRRDRSDIEFRDGHSRQIGKYLSPPGRGNMIFFAPGFVLDQLADADFPLVLTEGEFKAIALGRLAHYQTGEPRFLPIGLNGCWGWRATTGKTTGPNGDRRDVKGVCSDFDRIVWEGRRCYIALDADDQTNESVAAAKALLRRELLMRGGEVAFLDWSVQLGKGIDDLLANQGPEKVLDLISKADFESKSEEDENISVAWLADQITERYSFARDAGGKLYVFQKGVYQPKGERLVAQQVKWILKRLKAAAKWTSHKADEVRKYIATDGPELQELWEQPPCDKINLLNGILDVSNRKLAPHSPEFLSPVQLPIKYDPGAKCPAWDKFVSETFPEDSQALAWEMMAWLMTPHKSIQKAVLLLGDGRNGKSRFLAASRAFLGKANVSELSLHKIESDRFAAARLLGKLANICPDLPSVSLENTSVFKAITGGDEITAERKFHDSFGFVPHSRLVFSANHPPKSEDASPAFFRRWIVIPFERTFEEGAKGTIPSERLDAMLADPAELSGVLNRALDTLPSLRRRGFSETDSTEQAALAFQEQTNPFAVYLDRRTIDGPDEFIPCDTLRHAYNQDASAAGRPAMSQNAITKAFSKLRPGVAKREKTVNGRKQYCYLGIGLRKG